MFKSTVMRTMVAVNLCVIITAAMAGGAEPAGDTLFNIIPADVLFCVRVNNLDYTANMLDQFLAGVSPMPLGVSMMVRTQLAAMLGSPELAGVNMSGSFAVFAVAEANQPTPEIFGLIPISDYNQIIDANTNVAKPDANGISTVTANGKPLCCITRVGSYGLLARDYAKTLAKAKGISAPGAGVLASVLSVPEKKQAAAERIWAYGNIQTVSKTYGPMLFAQLEQLKTTMQKRADSNQPAPSMNPVVMMDTYSRLLKVLLDEGKSITIAASPKPDLLVLRTAFNALPGTETAGILVAEAATQRKNDLAGYAEDGAVMNCIQWTNHRAMKKINDKFITLMAQVIEKDPNAADVAKTRKLCRDLIDSLGGASFYSFLVKPNARSPIRYKYVIAVKDINEFNKATDEFDRTWTGSVIAEFLKKMGMETTLTVKRGVDSYNGIPIDAATFGMKWGDPNSPEYNMFRTMYGESLEYRWAIVNGLWVCTVANDPNLLRNLIDRVKAGPPAQVCSEMQKALAIVPDANNADMIVSYNYLRVFRVMSAMMPLSMAQIDIPSKSNLVFAGRIQNGSLAIDIGVPKEHLTEIMTAFQMMQQQMMQQQQMRQRPPAGPVR